MNDADAIPEHARDGEAVPPIREKRRKWDDVENPDGNRRHDECRTKRNRVTSGVTASRIVVGGRGFERISGPGSKGRA